MARNARKIQYQQNTTELIDGILQYINERVANSPRNSEEAAAQQALIELGKYVCANAGLRRL